MPILEDAVACYRGDFLAGFSLGDAPEFDDWIAVQREVWHRRLSLILHRLSEIQFAHGEYAGATETASRWIALDTLNEIAYRRKMRALFATGERGQALETYEACRTVLMNELGIEPDQDTTVLAEHIRTQPIHAPAFRRHIMPATQLPDTSFNFLGGLFTGREREYQTLVDSYALASEGHPQLVVLRGDTGIGKTRLARKFINWAYTQGAELLLGSPFESGSHLPFQPLVEALRLWLENDTSSTPLVDEVWVSSLTPLLPELRQNNSDLPGSAGDTSQSEIEISERQLYEPLVQCMLAVAKRAPLLLFLDDMQWADSATLELLQYATRRWQDHAARILFLASIRSEALHPTIQTQTGGNPQSLDQWLARMTRELPPVHIELEPLGEDETMKLMLSILSPPDADFAKWLYDETHGQPYYLIETLKDLQERSVLHPKRRGEGKWTLSVDTDHNLGQVLRVPSTVHAVIRSRLNRLSPKAFNLLAGGAVLENQITFERMCAISNMTEDQAIPALDELISGRLLLENFQPGVVSAYTFTNDMLRDVVYTEAGDA
ncbi:MAG TPA: AAA family ATPase, partial [Anaerolineales bacterium]